MQENKNDFEEDFDWKIKQDEFGVYYRHLEKPINDKATLDRYEEEDNYLFEQIMSKGGISLG